MEQKAKHLATIEINGHKYDARTGTRLSSLVAAPIRTVSDIIPANPASHTARSLHPSKHVHNSVQRGHTLMRRAVKKPAAPHLGKPVLAVEDIVSLTAPITEVTFRSHSDIIRSKRAAAVPKSSLVSRFSDIMSPSAAHHEHEPVKRHIAPMDVVPAPHHTTVQHTPAPVHHHAKTPNEKLLSAGLSHAHAHESVKHAKPKLHRRIAKRFGLGRRATNLAAGSLAVLLLGAFVTYQRIPNLAVRYASMKAGVNASLPGYHPAAFAVKTGVEYSPGEVAVNYQSNTDDRSYTVTQKNTLWDNSTLEQHLKEEAGKMPQSFAADNNTIYIQNIGDKVKASVIKNGVLKNISGDASLNTDQIIKIAQSM